MSQAYRSMMRGRYDPNLCCALYWRSQDHELLCECMAPLARLVLGSVMHGSYAGDEDYLQEGLLVLSQTLQRRTYKHHEEDPVHFDRYFYHVLRRTYYSYYGSSGAATQWLKDELQMYQPMYQVEHPVNVEWRIYLRQIPTLIRQMLADRVRFRDGEYRACMYICKRLMAGKQPVKRCLMYDYGIMNAEDREFFTSYMKVLLRSILREIRDTNGLYLGQMKQFMYEIPVEYESAA